MLNIAVLVSGGGTNLQALLDSEARGENPSGKIGLVVASKPGVYALERAASFGVESAVVSRKDYADSAAFDTALLEVLQSHPNVGERVKAIAAERARGRSGVPKPLPAFMGPDAKPDAVCQRLPGAGKP